MPSRKRRGPSYRTGSTLVLSGKGGAPRIAYCVACNTIDPEHADVFAIAGGTLVAIFQQRLDGEIQRLQEYYEEDEAELYYAGCWSMAQNGNPLFLFAGEVGIIKAVDCHTGSLALTLPGHGYGINELITHPVHHHLVLSGSKDESIRLWNTRSQTLVMIFGGLNGHKFDVLSMDIHPIDERIASCGIDNTVKLWDLRYHEAHVRKSSDFADPTKKFPTRCVDVPSFSTNKVHHNYVDCVKWYGDLLLSKSIQNAIILWKPLPGQNGSCDMALPLKIFEVEEW